MWFPEFLRAILAAVLFVIMISDVDEKVVNCVVRSFADDTRVNKMIKNEEDRVTLQKALDTIYAVSYTHLTLPTSVTV